MGNEYFQISFVIHSIGFLLLLFIALLWPVRKRLSDQTSIVFYFFTIVSLIGGIEQYVVPTGSNTEQGIVFFLLLPLKGFLLMNYLAGQIGAQLQNRLNYLLIAAVSVALTLYACGNTHNAWILITYFNSLFTTTLAIAALVILVKKNHLLFFKEDLFWISLGSAFYSLMYLLFSLLLLTGWYEKGGETEFSLLMDFFNGIQYGCFLFATLLTKPQEEQQP